MDVLPQTLGAPGVYGLPAPPRSAPALGGLPMDVCAFVGVAPRGPSRVPAVPETWRFDQPTVAFERRRSVAVPLESFDEYRRLYGGFEGPGRLPFAVASFFEQGGRRAYVVRVVHEYGDDLINAEGVATGILRGVGVAGSADAPALTARDEGIWGNNLRADLGFDLAPQAFRSGDLSSLTLDAGDPLPPGALLRLTLGDGSLVLRFVRRIQRRGLDQVAEEVNVATLEAPALAAPVHRAEIVEGVLVVDDGHRREVHPAVGLSARHPRWLATVLSNESTLVFPHLSWSNGDLVPERVRDLPRAPRVDGSPRFAGGADRSVDLEPDDFFGLSTVGDQRLGVGVLALAGIAEVASVVVPDLYVPEPLPALDRAADEPSLGGAEFAPCVALPLPAVGAETPAATLPGLHLDPANDLDAIIALQRRLIDQAEGAGRYVVLLDVPPGLTPRQVESWRSRLSSSYAAAYHPWLHIDRADDRRDALVMLNPSAVAAGVIAVQEQRFGIANGPANVIAAGVVAVTQSVSAAHHDRLHPQGVNVFTRERDGVRLSAARTLSRAPRLRQLSVRRLMIMIRRVLAEQTQWMVFEPNDAALQADVRAMLRGYLRRLFEQGALRGAREDDAFRVRCDAQLNTPQVVDAGRLIAEIQVAPAEPLEFIRLHLMRAGDGTVVREASA